MDMGSVSDSQIDHFQTVAQSISEHMCWSHILEELLGREDLAPATRDTQVTFLDENVNQVTALLTEITKAARIFAQAERYSCARPVLEILGSVPRRLENLVHGFSAPRVD